ncbi:cache domain-containing protein [Piscinibacter defluvii]|uniref:cache domain-containing protein n=1 Tax=Piscinibacter defluvii TaxID=1796922 RepID=UPI000FDDD57D|nr:cache domain-containing protein [Piscinibacter defluvii]
MALPKANRDGDSPEQAVPCRGKSMPRSIQVETPIPSGAIQDPRSSPARRGRRRNPPLAAVLLGSILAVLVPALGFGALSAWQAANANRLAATGRLQDTVHGLALSVDREIASIRSTMSALATSTVLDSRPPELQRFETEVRRASSVLDTSIVVLDAQDLRQLINTALPPGQAPRGVSAADFSEVVRTARPLVTNVVIGAVARKPVVGVAVPVQRDGAVSLIVAARLEPQRLQRLLAAQSLPTGAVATVLDAAGTVVAVSDGKLHAAQLGSKAATSLRPADAGQDHRVWRATRDGVEHVQSSRAIATAPGWTMVIAQPARDFDFAWRTPLTALVPADPSPWPSGSSSP